MLPLETSVDEVKRRLAAGEIILLDCREPHEYQTARIGDTALIPMREVPGRLQEVEAMAELPSRRAESERGALAAGAGDRECAIDGWRDRSLERGDRSGSAPLLTQMQAPIHD
jgi:hypothetical protein